MIPIDSLSDPDSEMRKKYRAMDNPADNVPMLVIGKFKVLGNIDTIMTFLKETQPKIKETLFDNVESENHEKLMKWHQNHLKPRCDRLVAMMKEKSARNADKSKEISRFEMLLKELDKKHKEGIEDYFSGTDTMCATDIILHSTISTVVYMYSSKEKLSDKEYPNLSSWMSAMAHD